MNALVPAASAELTARPADAVGGVSGEDWLHGLPKLIEQHLGQWRLAVDGEAVWGSSSLVVPVRRGATRLTMKLNWPHAAVRHEHLALQAWRGVGSVRLEAAHPSEWTVLLERCEPADDLRSLSALDAAEIVGSIHARLRRPALPQVDRLSVWCAKTAERLRTAPPPMPRRMVQQGIALAEDLAQDDGIDRFLIHHGSHDGRVMRAGRANTVGGYVAVSPRPMAGELAAAVAPLLWTRWDEAAQAYNLRNHLRFRVDYACDPMGVDPARARAWSILRILGKTLSEAELARQRREDSPPDVTQAVAMIKAMQN